MHDVIGPLHISENRILSISQIEICPEYSFFCRPFSSSFSLGVTIFEVGTVKAFLFFFVLFPVEMKTFNSHSKICTGIIL